MRQFQTSSPLAIASLIAANILSIFWALSVNVPVEKLLFLYWLETWIIGFYNFFKIRKASALISEKEERLMERQLFKGFFSIESPASVLTLFVVQYAFVVLLYGAVLFGFFVPFYLVKEGSYLERVVTVLPNTQEVAGLIALLFTFIISRGMSYALNFIGRQEFEKTSPVRQMLMPYDRIIAMHLFVVLGAMVFGTLQNMGIGPVDIRFSKIAVLLIKLLADLSGHLKEHLVEVSVGVQKQRKPEVVTMLEIKVPIWMKRFFLFLVMAISIAATVAVFETAKQNTPNNLSVPLLTTSQSGPSVSSAEEEDEIVPASITQTRASNELHVVFVSFGYEDFAVFQQDADRLWLYLLLREPFSEFASLFRFHFLATSVDFECQDFTEEDEAYLRGKLIRLRCNGEKIRQSIKDAKLPYNRTVVLINDPKLHGMDTVNGFMTVEWGGIPSDENIVLVNTARSGAERVFVHEFAHSFGLADEYLLYQTPGPQKDFCPDNCCHSSACSDWKDIPGASCIAGCSYPNWYRSSQDSTMRYAANEKFSPASLDILRRRLLRHVKSDLVVGSIGISWNKPHTGLNPQAHEGDVIAFYGETWNRGAQTADPSFMSGRIDIGSDGTWDKKLPHVPIASLAPDMTQRHRWDNMWLATAGKHIFEVCVDVTNVVEEADDKNNCKPQDFTVLEGSLN